MKGIPPSHAIPVESVVIRRIIQGVVGIFVQTLVVLAVLFFLVKADIYMFLQGLLPVTPSTLFLLCSLPLLYLMTIKSLQEERLPPSLFVSRHVILPFVILVVVSLVGILVRYPYIPEDLRPLFFPCLDFYVFIIGVLVGGIRIKESAWKAAMVVGLLVTIVTIAIDVYLPHTFTLKELEGPSGLAQNPNGGAYVALLLMISALSWERSTFKVNDILVIAVGFLAIFLTASRSGILAAAIVGVIYFMNTYKSSRLSVKIKLGSVIVCVLILVGSLFTYFFESAPVLESESSKGNQLLNLDAETLRFGDMASLERIAAVDSSLRIISEKTTMGMGTGYAYSMPVGPHNMYLARWVDNGFIGLLAYLWLIGAAFLVNWRNRHKEGMVISLMVFFFGFFSHNVLEDRTVLLLLAVSTARGASWIKESAFPPPRS